MDTWAVDNAIVNKGYELQNIKFKKGRNENKKCIIFFSSNGIYKEDNEETFKRVIFDENYFEWEHIAESYQIQNEYELIVFVRDVYKMWYVKGINYNCNSVDEVYKRLTQMTKGFQIVTVGNSAGGYAAVLFGKLLEAEVIYSFCGQFDLNDTVKNKPILIQYQTDSTKGKYYNLTSNIMDVSKTPILYFRPSNAINDIKQHDLVINRGDIYAFVIEGDVHGDTISGYMYPELLIQDINKLMVLSKDNAGKIFEKDEFAILVLGRIRTWKCKIRSKNAKGNIYEFLKFLHINHYLDGLIRKKKGDSKE